MFFNKKYKEKPLLFERLLLYLRCNHDNCTTAGYNPSLNQLLSLTLIQQIINHLKERL